ncbi:MarR family winged helix-turn-helix transcriptional regulator [Clostridium drakei]|uniref:MarR family transcriptional regulator n=2 Tax=Clostridium TaxID=1485 RepID=A0A2U8DTA1_9CLOT|nr:MarR family transcriptional regulator [Clostridium drakei]AWI05878.1 MarR family transcriptional regulator [Clostridium drakei]
MKQNIDKISELMIDVICEFYENDSKARTFGTDTELYHSEIHMLQCIMDNPGLHISGIARTLGITRGAASQTAKRLERKQMIEKKVNPIDSKKILMLLTTKGKTACLNHKLAHEKHRTVISKILSSSSAEQLLFLKSFLLKFETALKE